MEKQRKLLGRKTQMQTSWRHPVPWKWDTPLLVNQVGDQRLWGFLGNLVEEQMVKLQAEAHGSGRSEWLNNSLGQ